MKDRWEVRPLPPSKNALKRESAFPDSAFGVYEVRPDADQWSLDHQIPIAVLDHSHNHSAEWRDGIRLRAEIMAAGPELLDALAALIPDAENAQAGYQSTPMLAAKALLARLRRLPMTTGQARR